MLRLALPHTLHPTYPLLTLSPQTRQLPSSPPLLRHAPLASTMSSSLDSASPPGLELALKKLWRWNLICGILHLVQAIAVLAIALSVTKVKMFSIPMYTTVPNWSDGYAQFSYQYRGPLPFAGVTSGFAWMSAAAHFIVLACWPKYVRDLKAGINVFRWYEYSLSSSLMILLIAALYGIWDPVMLTLLGSVRL